MILYKKVTEACDMDALIMYGKQNCYGTSVIDMKILCFWLEIIYSKERNMLRFKVNTKILNKWYS